MDIYKFAYIGMTDFQKERLDVKYDLIQFVDNSDLSIHESLSQFQDNRDLNVFNNSFKTLEFWYFDFKKKFKEFI